MGYTRNVLAQGLRSKSAPLIGVCVPKARLDFFSALIETFQDLGQIEGYDVLQMLTAVDSPSELTQVKSMMNYKIGGLVLLPSLRQIGRASCRERVCQDG